MGDETCQTRSVPTAKRVSQFADRSVRNKAMSSPSPPFHLKAQSSSSRRSLEMECGRCLRGDNGSSSSDADTNEVQQDSSCPAELGESPPHAGGACSSSSSSSSVNGEEEEEEDSAGNELESLVVRLPTSATTTSRRGRHRQLITVQVPPRAATFGLE
jgi:hypothetical protein